MVAIGVLAVGVVPAWLRWPAVLTYGLGLQVAPDSDQVLLVRAGELTKTDGAGGLFYVVYVDIQTG